ncbi:hypothetical protein [Arthrobacter cryoconiti]|uniref:Integral membrane protein n=1 Tax=Arthrobacter cryoconiti TaxID=748907 RepID=A0ABV8R0F9_9MICC|nr:hypothetical protein [Arthrobacter cryoconiti]MCC9069303.1 hypothetical protein [Arthrobacter cryoconiti]
MESFSSDAHTHVEPERSSVMPVVPAPFTVRWDRTAFAVLGLVALLTAGVAGGLSVFGMGSAAVAWTALGVFIAVLAGLRMLVVRDQGRRRALLAEAGNRATADAQAPDVSGAGDRESVLFDRTVGAEPAPTQKPLTAAELRSAALRVAARGAADAKLAHTQTLADGSAEAQTWDPVEVPVPGYVTAARAASQAEPLVVPAVPRSAGTSIKADQAGMGFAVAQNGIVAPVVVEGGKSEFPKRYALNNLDDVLQRRRA